MLCRRYRHNTPPTLTSASGGGPTLHDCVLQFLFSSSLATASDTTYHDRAACADFAGDKKGGPCLQASCPVSLPSAG